MRPRWIWVVLVGFLLVAGAVGTLWYFTRPAPEPEGEPVVEDIEERGTRSVTLYFGNRNGDGLISERRTIPVRVHRDEEVETVVSELLRGPNARGAVRTFPLGTQLRRAYYDEEQRVLYLDFNSALVAEGIGGSAMETLTLGAVLRTIAVDFPEVRGVQFLVNGLEVETLGGHVDVTRPFRPRDWL